MNQKPVKVSVQNSEVSMGKEIFFIKEENSLKKKWGPVGRGYQFYIEYINNHIY